MPPLRRQALREDQPLGGGDHLVYGAEELGENLAGQEERAYLVAQHVEEKLGEILGRDYDKSQFNTLRRLRRSSSRQQPRWFRRVIPQSSDAK
jgi:hypothetical protein